MFCVRVTLKDGSVIVRDHEGDYTDAIPAPILISRAGYHYVDDDGVYHHIPKEDIVKVEATCGI